MGVQNSKKVWIIKPNEDYAIENQWVTDDKSSAYHNVLVFECGPSQITAKLLPDHLVEGTEYSPYGINTNGWKWFDTAEEAKKYVAGMKNHNYDIEDTKYDGIHDILQDIRHEASIYAGAYNMDKENNRVCGPIAEYLGKIANRIETAVSRIEHRELTSSKGAMALALKDARNMLQRTREIDAENGKKWPESELRIRQLCEDKFETFLNMFEKAWLIECGCPEPKIESAKEVIDFIFKMNEELNKLYLAGNGDTVPFSSVELRLGMIAGVVARCLKAKRNCELFKTFYDAGEGFDRMCRGNCRECKYGERDKPIHECAVRWLMDEIPNNVNK